MYFCNKDTFKCQKRKKKKRKKEKKKKKKKKRKKREKRRRDTTKKVHGESVQLKQIYTCIHFKLPSRHFFFFFFKE